MQRYFLNDLNQIEIDDTHHILNVMRFKSGTLVELCGKSGCFQGTLDIVNKHVGFTLGEKLIDNPPLNIEIVQGLPKGDKMDTVVKYATLFQAKTITFVPMKRSIAKLSNTEHKLNRLQKIAKESGELSKRSTLPKISFINSLSDLDYINKQVILLDELERTYTLKDLIDKPIDKDLVIVIGPEGGIDQVERTELLSKGAIALSLGLSILPTELAHIPILNAYLLKKL